MNKLGLLFLVMLTSLNVSATELPSGRCFPTPYTPPTQAQFCHIASRENCQAIGCEWRKLSYRCQAGPSTPKQNVQFCAIATSQNCEILGCEMTPYYSLQTAISFLKNSDGSKACHGETTYGPIKITMESSKMGTLINMAFNGVSMSGHFDNENRIYLEGKTATWVGRMKLANDSLEIAGKATIDFGGKDLREYPITSVLNCQ